ncbi:hypothetical protein F4802DRAFT_386769 [Xylaria palmicola]|nr:hypothetical protein F4802DRAFT_386769 [Xylaria palmicola]
MPSRFGRPSVLRRQRNAGPESSKLGVLGFTALEARRHRTLRITSKMIGHDRSLGRKVSVLASGSYIALPKMTMVEDPCLACRMCMWGVCLGLHSAALVSIRLTRIR